MHPLFLLLDFDDDTLINMLSFVGYGQYIFVALVCKKLKQLYKQYFDHNMKTRPPRVFTYPDLIIKLSYKTRGHTDGSRLLQNYTFLSAAFASEACAIYWLDNIQQERPSSSPENVLAANDNILALAARHWDQNIKEAEARVIFRIMVKAGNLKVLMWAKEKGYQVDHSQLGAQPCTEAARTHNWKVLKWLVQNGYSCDAATIRHVAAAGNLAVLQYLDEHGCLRWNEMVSPAAARGGYLDVVQYLHERGCLCNEDTCYKAASCGHLNVLMYANENGCQWTKATCRSAASGGHLNVLQYLYEKGCDMQDAELCYAAAVGGQVHILEWLQEPDDANRKPCAWDMHVYIIAARNGHVNILKYAYEKGCPLEDAMAVKKECWDRAQYGMYPYQTLSLDILKWGHELPTPVEQESNKPMPPHSHWVVPALAGRLDMFQWAKEQGFSSAFNEDTCEAAAQGGHLELLEFIHKNGCPWDNLTCAAAAKEGYFGILQWAYSNGCPLVGSEITECAAIGGHLEILKWARDYSFSWNSRVCTAAAEHGHFHVLKWAHQNGCPWDEFTWRAAFKKHHYYKCLKYVIENNCPGSRMLWRPDGNGELELFQSNNFSHL
jgi:hypothetical protein